MSGGVGGSRCAIAATRPDRRQAVPACSGDTLKLELGMWTAQDLRQRAMEPPELPAPEALQPKRVRRDALPTVGKPSRLVNAPSPGPQFLNGARSQKKFGRVEWTNRVRGLLSVS
jgi:hypothetical protein